MLTSRHLQEALQDIGRRFRRQRDEAGRRRGDDGVHAARSLPIESSGNPGKTEPAVGPRPRQRRVLSRFSGNFFFLLLRNTASNECSTVWDRFLRAKMCDE